jgi:hypothetical protein
MNKPVLILQGQCHQNCARYAHRHVKSVLAVRRGVVS